MVSLELEMFLIGFGLGHGFSIGSGHGFFIGFGNGLHWNWVFMGNWNGFIGLGLMVFI